MIKGHYGILSDGDRQVGGFLNWSAESPLHPIATSNWFLLDAAYREKPFHVACYLVEFGDAVLVKHGVYRFKSVPRRMREDAFMRGSVQLVEEGSDNGSEGS